MIFKNRNGSLLIEAVFSLCIGALLIACLFNSLATLVQQLGSNHQKIAAFFQAKHFLQTTLFERSLGTKKERSPSVQIAENDSTLTYSEEQANQKSIFNNPYLVKVTVLYTWQSFFKNGTDTITMYRVEIPQEKK